MLLSTCVSVGIAMMPMMVLAKQDRDMLRSLTYYRWHNRLLVVFAPHAGHEDLAKINRLLQHDGDEADDRDIVVLRVIGDDLQIDAGHLKPAPGLGKKLRRDHKVRADSVSLILIGKDGGEKARQTPGTLNLQKLWDLIDTMPMRRRELRDRGLR